MAYLCVNRNGQEVLCPNEPSKQYGEWLHFKSAYGPYEIVYTTYNGQGGSKLQTLLEYYGYRIKGSDIIDTDNRCCGEIIENQSYYFYTENAHYSGYFVNSDNFGELYEKELTDIIPEEIMNQLHSGKI